MKIYVEERGKRVLCLRLPAFLCAPAIKKCLPEACGRAGLNKAIKVVKQLKRSGALCGEYEFITVESRKGDRVVITL